MHLTRTRFGHRKDHPLAVVAVVILAGLMFLLLAVALGAAAEIAGVVG
jgi:hypothetical protein